MLGLVYFPVLIFVDKSGPESVPKFLVLLAVVFMIAFFAVRSFIKEKSRVGAVAVILADILLLFLSQFWYSGL